METETNIAEKPSTRNAAGLFKSFGVLVAGGMIYFLQSGSFKACGVLFDDVVKRYETSYLYGGWIFTLQPAACFITAGIAGAALSQISNRAVGVIGGILFAAGTGFLYLASYMAYTDHFPDCFPLAYSVRDVFAYLGITSMPPLLELFRKNYGLHGAFLILGAISLNGITAGVLLKPCQEAKRIDKNDPKHSLNNNNNCQNEFFQRKFPLLSLVCISSLQNHPIFILFNILHALLSFNYAVWALFLVPYGLSLGYSPEVAVFLSTAGGLGGFFGKLVVISLFYFRDTNQIAANIIPVLIYGIAMAGYVLFADYIALLTSSFLSGFSLAFIDALTCGMLPKYICKDHLRQGLVVSYLGSGIAIQLGGISAGAILDATSSLSIVFGVMFAFNAVIGVLAFIMKKLECQV